MKHPTAFSMEWNYWAVKFSAWGNIKKSITITSNVNMRVVFPSDKQRKSIFKGLYNFSFPNWKHHNLSNNITAKLPYRDHHIWSEQGPVPTTHLTVIWIVE